VRGGWGRPGRQGTIARALVTGAVWLVLWPRTVPDPAVSDRGTFVSVAERLLAGDRLYSGVWDNKDPLFYYANAIARLVGPPGDVVLELVWLSIAMLAVRRLTRALGATPAAQWALPMLATPVVLTGWFYFAGHTHLPGTAIALAVVAATTERRYLIAGVLLGLLAFLKITAAPIAGVAVLGLLLVRRSGRGLVVGAAGFTLVVATVLTILASRGELTPYATVLLGNVGYADPTWLDSGRPAWQAHLLRVWSPSFAVATAAVLGLLFAGVRRSPHGGWRPTRADIWWASVAALLASFAVLTLTAYWPHHAQALSFPGLLALTVVVSTTDWPAAPRTVGGLLVVATLCVAGLPRPQGYLDGFSALPRVLGNLTATTAQTGLMLASSPAASYARVGANDDGHAWGLRGWELACARFHQYPFDPQRVFEETVSCLPTADVVVVAANAQPVPERTLWNSFLSDVDRIVAEGYTCEAIGGGRVCRRAAL